MSLNVTKTNVTLLCKCSCCIGTIWKAIVGTLWDRLEYIWAFLSAQRPSGTELLHKQGLANEVSNDQDCWLPHYTGSVLWWTENLLGMCCIVCIPHYVCSVFDIPRNLLVWYVLGCTYPTLYIFCILCTENLYLSGMCYVVCIPHYTYSVFYVQRICTCRVCVMLHVFHIIHILYFMYREFVLVWYVLCCMYSIVLGRTSLFFFCAG